MMPHATNGLGAAVARLLRRHPQGASGGPVATAAGPYAFWIEPHQPAPPPGLPTEAYSMGGRVGVRAGAASFGGCRSVL